VGLRRPRPRRPRTRAAQARDPPSASGSSGEQLDPGRGSRRGDVAPQRLEAGSSRACRGVKHVDHHVEVVHEDPSVPRRNTLDAGAAKQAFLFLSGPGGWPVVDRLRLAVPRCPTRSHEEVGVAGPPRAGRAERCRMPSCPRRGPRSWVGEPARGSGSWRQAPSVGVSVQAPGVSIAWTNGVRGTRVPDRPVPSATRSRDGRTTRGSDPRHVEEHPPGHRRAAARAASRMSLATQVRSRSATAQSGQSQNGLRAPARTPRLLRHVAGPTMKVRACSGTRSCNGPQGYRTVYGRAAPLDSRARHTSTLSRPSVASRHSSKRTSRTGVRKAPPCGAASATGINRTRSRSRLVHRLLEHHEVARRCGGLNVPPEDADVSHPG